MGQMRTLRIGLRARDLEQIQKGIEDSFGDPQALLPCRECCLIQYRRVRNLGSVLKHHAHDPS